MIKTFRYKNGAAPLPEALAAQARLIISCAKSQATSKLRLWLRSLAADKRLERENSDTD